GIPVAANGVDNFQAGLRELWTGQYVQTYTSQAIQWGAEEAGASPSTAYNIGEVGNGVIGFAGTLGAGLFNDASQGSWLLNLFGRAGVPVAEGVTPGTGVMFGGDWNAYFESQVGTTNVGWTNPASAVETKALLAAKVAEAEAILLANPYEAQLRGILTEKQVDDMVLGGRLAAANYGRAVEGVAAQLVSDNPLVDPYLVYVARTKDIFTRQFVPSMDFIGIEGYNLRPLEVTTSGQIPGHLARGYVSMNDIITYGGLPW
ncbi:MAG: hypothetical protein ACYCUV_13620, partial [Phycisphaerae bacterium]